MRHTRAAAAPAASTLLSSSLVRKLPQMCWSRLVASAVCLAHPSHHGARPVRKSCSVQGDTATLPSWVEVCASAKESGAGPRTTLPFSSYCDPWHGQMNLFEALTHGTTQPRCVQTALSAKSLMPVSVAMRYVASPFRPCTSSRSFGLWALTHFSSETGAPH